MNLKRKMLLITLAAALLLGVLLTLKWNRPAAAERGETVVLLHGMGRTRVSLLILAHGLEKRGYRVLNFPYDERQRTVAEVADDLHAYLNRELRGEPYHLVGHSLGNIVIRAGFKKEYSPGLSRIVMLAPPNHPARLAEMLANNRFYKWRTGDAGQRLADKEFYRSLPIPTVPFGIIAGTTGQPLTFSEANDGVIRVSSTKLEGMADWISVPRTHTLIMNGDDTLDLLVHFLESGSF